jgi:hypothetical protein
MHWKRNLLYILNRFELLSSLVQVGTEMAVARPAFHSLTQSLGPQRQ